MPDVAIPPMALMMVWIFFEGVRLTLKRLHCGDLWWPRLWSGIWTWFCALVYALMLRPCPLPQPVLVVYVVDGWGWQGDVVGGRGGRVDGVRSRTLASKEMI